MSEQPNILRVIEYDETPNPYYVMPYYRNGTLKDVHSHGLHEDMFPKILLQLLLGLRALHKLGFAHRDLKEDNILVDDDFTLIFGDPDHLKSVNDTALKTICGTGMYAAPEIWHGTGQNYGISVDIWSLAITILSLFYDVEPSDQFPKLLEKEKVKAWNSKWYKTVLSKLDDLDENNDQIIDILKLMLRLDPAERATVDQCLERGCENGLFRTNRLGEIVLAKATEVNTEEVKIPTGDTLPDLDPKYDNPIPTIESHEDNYSGYGEGVKTPTARSPAISEDGSSGDPARRLRQASRGESDWSWTVALEFSSPESGSMHEDRPAKSNKEDLSKLRLVKQTFSSSSGSSFSNRERGVSTNPDVV